MTTVTARPLRADAARNRERILTAATEVFAARGLEVTLDEIARHAGLGTGTVYRRFASKEALVEALFEQRLAEIIVFARECVEHPDPWAGFELLVRRAAHDMARDRGLRQVMLSSSLGITKVAEARRQIVPISQRLVQRAKAAGVMRAEVEATDVQMLLLMLGTVCDFAVDSTLYERYLVFLLDGLKAGHTAAVDLPEALAGNEMMLAMSTWRPARST